MYMHVHMCTRVRIGVSCMYDLDVCIYLRNECSGVDSGTGGVACSHHAHVVINRKMLPRTWRDTVCSYRKGLLAECQIQRGFLEIKCRLKRAN